MTRFVWARLVPLAIVASTLWGSAPAQPGPVADAPRGDLRLVLFGDFNGPYGSLAYPSAVARTVAAITDVWRPDLVLLPGDLVAGQSAALPDQRFAQMWAVFDDIVAAPLRRAGIPYAATMGNHDASKLRDARGAYAFARERDAAAAYWRQPHHLQGLEVVDDAAYPFAWSFLFGPLFVAVIDASGPVIHDDERRALEATLRSGAARDADARWVMGHLPLLGIAQGRDRVGEVVWEADSLRDLMLDGGVDTYVSGHQAAFYAGTWDGLELVFTGGVGARPLLGGAAPRRSAVTVVDMWIAPTRVQLTTFEPGTLEPLPPDTLPAVLAAFGGTLVRSQRLQIELAAEPPGEP